MPPKRCHRPEHHVKPVINQTLQKLLGVVDHQREVAGRADVYARLFGDGIGEVAGRMGRVGLDDQVDLGALAAQPRARHQEVGRRRQGAMPSVSQ